MIHISNVRKHFGDKEVLKGINLEVHKGEIIGLLGPSGAGKTTLIKLLTGQLIPDEGEILVFEKEVGTLDGESYRRFGMMLDNFGLYERLTVSDNLKLFARLYQIPNEKINETLDSVGLTEAAKRPVMKLSKGMRGRLSLARAVLNEPDILFLDEPTTGLDPATAAEIHELIKAQKKRGATIFLTTHNMQEAEKLCDHVALLNEGSIVEYGEPQEICRRYNHQNMIKIHFLDGKEITLPNHKDSAEAVGTYLSSGQIETIHSSEPNLETVFMELTGRGFEA